MKVKSESEVAQSCMTLSNPMDCSLPGSSVHGIFQARVLEWGAIAFSKASQKHPLGICKLPQSKLHAQLPSWKDPWKDQGESFIKIGMAPAAAHL